MKMPAATRPAQVFASMGAGEAVMGAGRSPWGKWSRHGIR